MKNTLLLFLCTTFLNVFGQNFRSTPDGLHPKRYAEIKVQPNIAVNDVTLSGNTLIRHKDLSNQLRSLVSSTNVQIIDSIYMWQWDSLSQEWLVDYRINDIMYGADLLPASYVSQYWNGDEWVNDIRYSNTYSSNNLPLTEIEEEWDGEAWQYYYQIIYEYDDQSNLTTFTAYEWEGDFWELSDRFVITHNTMNLKESAVYQSWTGSGWQDESQALYTYDENNNLSYELNQLWDGNAWLDITQVFNTYDHLSNQLFDLVQTFDGIEWINFSQSGFQYDLQHNRTYHLYQTWNGIEWENEYQYHYTFDGANNPATDFVETWNGTDWDNYSDASYTHDAENFRISEVFGYYFNGAPFITFGDSTHYYYHSVTGVADVSSSLNEWIISPNPTTGIFAIDNTDEIIAIDVYNITGALIEHVEPSQDVNHLDVNISGNNPGIYLLQVRTASAVYCTKVMLH